ALTSVTGRDGKGYKVKETAWSRAVEEQHVSDLGGTLLKIAKTRVAKGTFNVPLAGKTGSNNGATSTGFVGYTTGISTASWVGRLKGQGEDRKENLMHGALINDQRAPSMVDSSTYAAPLWLDFMQEAVYDYPHE